MKIARLDKQLIAGCKMLSITALAVSAIFALVAGCFIILLLVIANPPLIRLDYQRFAAPDPELIQLLTPYLSIWLNKPPEETAHERTTIGSEQNVQIFIDHATDTLSGETFPVINILVENWYTWQRGYFYTESVLDLEQVSIVSLYGNPKIKQLDEHWYVYNQNAD